MMAQEILLHVGIVMSAICCDVRGCSWMCRGELGLCFFFCERWSVAFCCCEGAIASTSLKCKHSSIRRSNGKSSSSQALSTVLS